MTTSLPNTIESLELFRGLLLDADISDNVTKLAFTKAARNRECSSLSYLVVEAMLLTLLNPNSKLIDWVLFRGAVAEVIETLMIPALKKAEEESEQEGAS